MSLPEPRINGSTTYPSNLSTYEYRGHGPRLTKGTVDPFDSGCLGSGERAPMDFYNCSLGPDLESRET